MKIHVRIQNKTFEVRLGDLHSRPIQAQVDGESFEVWPEEMMVSNTENAQVMSSAAPIQPRVDAPSSTVDAKKVKDVVAPLPGVIIEINAKVGDKVKFGDALCVLEAMKMKNAIRAGREGEIAVINVAVGDSVQHSQVLMEFKD